MYDWQIILCLPVGTSENGKEKIFTSSVTFSHGDTNAYMAVEKFNRAAIKDAFVTREVNVRINLRDIVNLHNCDGIKDISRVKQMKKKIDSGRHILQKDEIPNIKLVRAKTGEIIIFDGHHSMLAYMSSGKTYLDEIPYLFVSRTEGAISNEEILAFFGNHSYKIRPDKWKKYVVNWQAVPAYQLCLRIQNNMGELYNIIFGQISHK
ncbi:hypothetical protein SCALIN_C28_0344 [Candidatus Scalindua japonica]|uniref:Uncharacterized protein n=1 Tax=Candidatus Scalindua japonica TaxID=1284222 RepID=A0A286U1W2_9BACT|nr:hypothetical protein [Candidatus Scalindua japonica]GAX62140.1 hypothetical protein SCALIN_C28_0344 [Candidatus Scalindua japonica]